MEKVYAKIYGCYAAIESGHSSSAFRDLTGAPTEEFMINNSNDAYKYLLANFRKGFLMTVGSK